MYRLLVFVQDWAILQWHRATGHHNLIVFERGHIFLECATCHRRTPGWDATLGSQVGTAADR